jgi:hypothetical protein
MNYQANHIIIALTMTLALSFVTVQEVAFLLPALFYFIREVWQYFYLERTEDFDWGGTTPVNISQLLAYLICVT